jgi:hypothetical protein
MEEDEIFRIWEEEECVQGFTGINWRKQITRKTLG